jgi:ABC-type transport system substrate-binding protein
MAPNFRASIEGIALISGELSMVLRALAISLAMVAFTAAASSQELKVGLSAEPSAMDPHYHNLTPNNSILSHVFERLIATDEKQRLLPGLAESWKVVDETVWEFKLRRGVTWHDGSPSRPMMWCSPSSARPMYRTARRASPRP